MKRKLTAVVLSAILALSVSGNVFAETVSVPASRGIIKSSRMLISILSNKVFENLGFNVSLNGDTITIKDSEHTITIKSGQKNFVTDGKTITPDVPQEIVDNKLLIPIRAVAESFGAKVDWIPSTKTALITYRDKKVSVPVDNDNKKNDTNNDTNDNNNITNTNTNTNTTNTTTNTNTNTNTNTKNNTNTNNDTGTYSNINDMNAVIAAYENEINYIKNSLEEEGLGDTNSMYWIFDINKDGIKELIIHKGYKYEADAGPIEIYTYKNGKVTHIGGGPNHSPSLYAAADGNGIIAEYFHQFTALDRITYVNGVLKDEYIISVSSVSPESDREKLEYLSAKLKGHEIKFSPLNDLTLLYQEFSGLPLDENTGIR